MVGRQYREVQMARLSMPFREQSVTRPMVARPYATVGGAAVRSLRAPEREGAIALMRGASLIRDLPRLSYLTTGNVTAGVAAGPRHAAGVAA